MRTLLTFFGKLVSILKRLSHVWEVRSEREVSDDMG